MMTVARRVARMLDANANRAQEGLRVCEDVCRFCLEHPGLFRTLRALRHDVARACGRLPLTTKARLQARNSRWDAGREAKATAYPRGTDSIAHLLLLNLQRVKEALRVLEEGCRLAAPQAVGGFQRLRFRTYDLERRAMLHVATVRHPRRRRQPRP